MKILFNLKRYLYTGLREVLVYHHSSLEFRAKIFALIIAANEHPSECEYDHVHEAGLKVYKDDDRAGMLVLTTQEYVKKVHQKNGLDLDDLIMDVQRELHEIPRYVSKIDIALLEPIVECSIEEDTSTYQIRILEFLSDLKNQYGKDK